MRVTAWLLYADAVYKLPRWIRPYKTMGTLAMDRSSLQWRPLIAIRTSPFEVELQTVQRIRLLSSFVVTHLWIVTGDTTWQMTAWPKRRLFDGLRAAGFVLHTRPSWPGVTIAARPGIEIAWTHDV